MKKAILAVIVVVILVWVYSTSIDFMESMQVEGQHEKALKFLGNDKGTLVYKASSKAKECLRSKMEARGYYMLQDDIDCWDNEVK